MKLVVQIMATIYFISAVVFLVVGDPTAAMITGVAALSTMNAADILSLKDKTKER